MRKKTVKSSQATRCAARLFAGICAAGCLLVAGCSSAQMRGTMPDAFLLQRLGNRATVGIPESLLTGAPISDWAKAENDGEVYHMSDRQTVAAIEKGSFATVAFAEETNDIEAALKDCEKRSSFRLKLVPDITTTDEHTGITAYSGHAKAQALFTLDDYAEYTGRFVLYTDEKTCAFVFAGQAGGIREAYQDVEGAICQSLEMRPYDLVVNEGGAVASKDPPGGTLAMNEEGTVAVPYTGTPGSPAVIDGKIMCLSVTDGKDMAKNEGMPETKGKRWLMAELSLSFPDCDVTGVLPALPVFAEENGDKARVLVREKGAGRLLVLFEKSEETSAIDLVAGTNQLHIKIKEGDF